MRNCYIALMTLAFLGFATRAATADDMLTGQMAGHNFLLGGSWSCVTDVPAIMSMAARREAVTVTFDVAPHNVLHAAIVGADERGDRYFGYSARFNNYWSAGASSHAIYDFATSTDGMTFVGKSYLGTGSMNDTTTYTKISGTKTNVREVLSGNGGSWTIETACSR